MIRFLFSRFWFALIPIFVYLVWANIGQDKEHKTKQKAKRWTIAVALIIILCSALYMGITAEENDGTYIPAKFEDGVLKDGEIK